MSSIFVRTQSSQWFFFIYLLTVFIFHKAICLFRLYELHKSKLKAQNTTILFQVFAQLFHYCKTFPSFSAKCQPGYYSDNGLHEVPNSPCVACPRDTYNPFYSQTACQFCPMGSHTSSNGSTSFDDCVGKCCDRFGLLLFCVYLGCIQKLCVYVCYIQKLCNRFCWHLLIFSNYKKQFCYKKMYI